MNHHSSQRVPTPFRPRALKWFTRGAGVTIFCENGLQTIMFVFAYFDEV